MLLKLLKLEKWMTHTEIALSLSDTDKLILQFLCGIIDFSNFNNFRCKYLPI